MLSFVVEVSTLSYFIPLFMGRKAFNPTLLLVGRDTIVISPGFLRANFPLVSHRSPAKSAGQEVPARGVRSKS